MNGVRLAILSGQESSMSTTLDGRKAKKNYAEFDEYISYQLQKTQTGIRSTDVFTALCGAAVFVVSYLLVFVVFDHWIVTGGFGPAMRFTLLAGLLLGTLSWLGWKVAWPFFRRVNSLYAARVLEQASPELKSTLLNYVDLRSAAREVSPSILSSMEKRAAVTLSHTEVDDAIDRSLLLKLSYALLIAVVLFSIYSATSPKKVWPSIVRIFVPGSEVSVSTQTAFLKVTPGDTTVLAREFLTVTTDLAGEVPQDVTLLYTTADGQFVNEPVSMHEVEAGLKRYRCILKGVGGEGLLQNLSYRITAGDAATPDYQVTVTQPPSATVKSLRYRFPDYMELPPEDAVGSNVDTWEGTQIELTATANMPVESAKLQFSDEVEFPARCEEMRMTVASDGVTLTPAHPWQPIIREDDSYPRFFRIQCRTSDGATDPTPAVHSIRLQRDRRPDVSTLQPTRDLEVAANAIVPLLIQASDPDFRLSQIVLRMKNGNRSLPKQSLYKGNDREKLVRHDLKIADLNAMPGDVITWWVEAHDNRRVETPSRILLDTNHRTTPPLKITIKAPVSEDEVNQQLERDSQRAQDKLDELDQPTNSETAVPDESGSASPNQQSDSTDGSTPDEEGPASENKDEQDPAESSTDDQSTNGASGDGGTPGNDAQSNRQDGSETSSDAEKSQDSSDGSSTGKEKPGTKNPTDQSDTDGADSRSGPRKPVRNDGSQDDEILSELLKRNRDAQLEDQPKKEGRQDQSPDDSADSTKADPSRNEEDTRNEEPSGTSESNDPGSRSQEKSETDRPGDKSSDPTNPNDTANTPSEQKQDRSKDDPETGSRPSETPKENGVKKEQDATPDASDPENKNSPENQTDSSAAPEPGKQDGEKSDTQPSGNDSSPENPTSSEDSDESSSGKSQTNDNSGDTGNSSSSRPSPNETPTENTPTSGRSETDNGNSTSSSESGSDSGKSRSSNQSGKPGDGATGEKSGSSPPSTTKPAGSSESGGTGDDGTPGSPSSSPPETGSTSTSPNGSRDSNSSPSSDSRNQSASDRPGDGQKDSTKDGMPDQPTEDQTGRDPDGKGTGSKQGDVKSGADSNGNPTDRNESGSSGSGPESGNPGSGQSSGGKPQGQSGSGQSTEQGGTPGQSTGGSTPRKGSSPDGDPIFQPDDNANVNDAVERPASGANVHDPSLTDPDPSNLEDKLKASNMVLKRLQEELDRGEVDQDLLKKLGWTEQDMKRFAERLERQLAQPKPNDPAAEARRRQFEETLRSVDLESSGRSQDGNYSNQKPTSNFTERRLPPPRSHRKAYEEYIRRLSRQRRDAPARPPQK